MNLLTKPNFMDSKNKNIISNRKNQCKCGKTKDSNGNCDGSHAK